MSDNELAKKGWFMDRVTMRTLQNKDGRVIERSQKDGVWYLMAKKPIKLYRSLADSLEKVESMQKGKVKA